MHQSSLDKMEDFKRHYLKDRQKDPLLIFDLGSRDVNGSYRPLFDISPWTYRGVDTDMGENVDIILDDSYDWKKISSNSVDVLISGQAFEHIEFFWITMLEIERVLKPNGLCCIIAPSGGFEHRYPVDCWRFYTDGFSALGRFVGFEVLDVSTQWKPDPRYTDLCNAWRDSVLIARKKYQSLFLRWRRRIVRYLLHKLSLMQLKRM